MNLYVYETEQEMAAAAAEKAAEVLKQALAKKPTIRLIAATGNAQFKFLEKLYEKKDIDWRRITLFHLDEYIGISKDHPASFARYIQERIVDKLHPGKAFLIDGSARDVEAERKRISALVSEAPVDVAFVGIGENGHLAFNDPPADFETSEPYIIVNLDERCRTQQVGEGWYRSLDEVPRQAFSMSIKQIMKTACILAIVPEKRKAEAVFNCLSEKASVSPLHPASILKTHPNAHIFLDKDSASLLRKT
ncbi:MAG TPA: glucosamine-6-phosphate deaminase [Spirochaetales bacterium]|nr:glucosamine-6-phosphate deaminase [Spirochaetales bacterium]